MASDETLLDELALMCTNYPSDPYNTEMYDSIVDGCRKIAYSYLRKDYYIPPTVGRITYHPYKGQGNIHVERTIQGFSIHGRNMDCVMGRKRSYDIRRKNFALIIDNSIVTTAQGLASKIKDHVHAAAAPEIMAKIAAISIIESNKRTSDFIDIIPLTDTIEGPYNIHQYSYKQILLQKGNGTNRLDLALARLLQTEWDKRKGMKHLAILTTGIPEIGRGNLLDDIEAQENAIHYLRHLQKRGVNILYLSLTTDERFAEMRVGSHSPKSFLDKLSMHGITTQEIKDVQTLPQALRNGFKQMNSRRTFDAYLRMENMP